MHIHACMLVHLCVRVCMSMRMCVCICVCMYCVCDNVCAYLHASVCVCRTTMPSSSLYIYLLQVTSASHKAQVILTRSSLMMCGRGDDNGPSPSRSLFGLIFGPGWSVGGGSVANSHHKFPAVSLLLTSPN